MWHELECTWNFDIMRHRDLVAMHCTLERLRTDIERSLSFVLTTVIDSRWVHIFVLPYQLSLLRPYESVVLSEHNDNRNWLRIANRLERGVIKWRSESILWVLWASSSNFSSPTSKTRPPAVGIFVQSLITVKEAPTGSKRNIHTIDHGFGPSGPVPVGIVAR